MDIDFDFNLRHKDSLGKFVKVNTVDSRTHEGWLKCINPIAGDLILATFDENCTQINDSVLILGSEYKSLEVLKETDDKIMKLLKDQYRSDNFCPAIAAERKKRLISWIKKHRLPVIENEDGTLLVCESVAVCAPYEMINCSSLNARVLKNIRELVWKLPEGDVENHDCEVK